MAIGFVVPLEDGLPTFRGVSLAWVLFAVLAALLLGRSVRSIERAALSGPGLALCLLSGYALVLEVLSHGASPSGPFRLAQMGAGAILLGALCRNRVAAWGLLYGFLAAGTGLAVSVTVSSYRALTGTTVSAYQDANELRLELFAGGRFVTNLNNLALITALTAIVAFQLATRARRWSLVMWSGVGFVSALGTLTSLSRGGLLILVLGGMAVLALAVGHFGPLKTSGIAVAIAALLVVMTPSATFARISGFETGETDPRTQILHTLLDDYGEYGVFGVGFGNYYSGWAQSQGLYSPTSGSARGPHNAYLAALVYWGAGGLICELVLIAVSVRAFRRWRGDPRLHDALLPALVVLPVALLFTHQLELKVWSIFIGSVIGGSIAIRNAGRGNDGRLAVGPQFRHAATFQGDGR